MFRYGSFAIGQTIQGGGTQDSGHPPLVMRSPKFTLNGYTVSENGAAADTIVVTVPKAAVTKKFARVSAE